MSVVYLLHFEGPGLPVTANRVARHYIGWTTDRGSLWRRIAHHRAGSGSRICRAACEAGNVLVPVRLWSGMSRLDERALKRQSNAPRYCPICAAENGVGMWLGPGRAGGLPRDELDVVRAALRYRRRLDDLAA